MEGRYSVSALGVDVTARTAKAPGITEFYKGGKLLATYEFKSCTLVYDRAKAMEDEADLDLCRLLCKFASEMIFGKQLAVGGNDGISDKLQRNEGKDYLSR